jgi:hypothetical protein
MRLYSNIPLSWPNIVHTFYTGRLYPGRWHNNYYYRVTSATYPVRIQSECPISLLRDNHKYYCYDLLYRDEELEKYGNEITNMRGHYIYLPKYISDNDIISINIPNNMCLA